MKTNIETYRRAYDSLVTNKSDKIIEDDGRIKTFEEYLDICERRINRFKQAYK